MRSGRITITLGAFMVLVTVLSVLAVLGMLAVRSFLLAREQSRKNACIGQLAMLHSACEQYVLEYGGTATTVVAFADAAIYIKYPERHFCPAATGTNCTFSNSYAINAVTAPPLCKVMPETHVLKR